jgi:hypothetical protein
MKMVIPLLLGFLFCCTENGLYAQMNATVNSLADDAFAHAYDFQSTPLVDESMDGVCEDSLHRCTLRAALEEAAIRGTSARVTFSVSGNILMGLDEGSFYPPDDSWIQGNHQNVSIIGNGNATPVIFEVGNHTLISGLHMTNALIGLNISGNHNQIGVDDPVTANYITAMTQNGIIITGDSNRITGNVIGLDLLGHAEGSPFGIFVFGNGNLIGGLNPGEGNVISGNDKGVAVYSLDSLNEIAYIVGNFIGTDINGTAAVGNKVGIEVTGYNTVIGGPVPAAMNVISGNTESGILTGVQATGLEIAGNHIGVDKTGNILIPNRDGIALGPGSESCSVDSNLIKGNSQFGIYMSGLPDSALASAYHDITGNEILMNAQAGIAVANNTHDVVIGYGRDNVGAPNMIQFNGNGGIVFSQTFGTAVSNTIRRNNLKQNHLKGIDIKTFCPNCQETILPPEIVQVTRLGNIMFEVVGTHARAGSIIDVYSGDLNQSGQFEGLHWLGSGIVAADHIFQFNVEDCGCDLVVATASDPQGNTSEFSIGTLVMMTAVENPKEEKSEISVYPNPFQSAATIRFKIPQSGDVDLSVYDSEGQLMQTLCHEHLIANTYERAFIAGTLPAGFYYYRLTSGSGKTVTGKLISLQ